MTALAGLLLSTTPQQPEIARILGLKLLAAIPGRGRDDTGVWVSNQLVLAARMHRTLDLTPDDAQPFTSFDGQITVILDGYISNSKALRQELERELEQKLEETGTRLRGHSCAELVAEGTALWGLNRLLQKIDGAFTIVINDSAKKELHLVRDRMGARPLYITKMPSGFAFASDMQAFLCLNDFEKSLNAGACAHFLAWGHLQNGLTLWNNVVSVPPAHRIMLRYDDSQKIPEKIPEPEAYWSTAATLEENALRQPSSQTQPLAQAALQCHRQAVQLDTTFCALGDHTPAASALRQWLPEISEKPVKTYDITPPDGPAIQAGFEALSQLAMPTAHPQALHWWHALSRASADAAVALIPSTLTRHNKKPEKFARAKPVLAHIPKTLHRFIPASMQHLTASAHDTYANQTRIWPNEATLADVLLPRIDTNLDAQIDYYSFKCALCENWLPTLDRLAANAGIEMRMPMAALKTLDYAFPTPPTPDYTDTAIWLRGPIRLRVQDLINQTLCTRIGTTDHKTIQDMWARFLAGDNAQTSQIWTLAILLAWVSKH